MARLKAFFRDLFKSKRSQSIRVVPVGRKSRQDLEYQPCLFSYFPELAENLAWKSLRSAEEPAIPRQLKRSQQYFGDHQVFMKRESLDADLMSDTDARMLEFDLAEVLKTEPDKIVASDYLGSSYPLAVAQACSLMSLECELILVKREAPEFAIRNDLKALELGTKMEFVSNLAALQMKKRWRQLRSKFQNAAFLEFSGLSKFGVIGYVNAFAELAIQMREHETQSFDRLFVALGNGAALTGFEVGKKLFGLDNLKIVAVDSGFYPGIEADQLAELGNESIELLNQFLDKKISNRLKAQDFRIEAFDSKADDVKVIQICHRMGELEGLEIDVSHGGPALCGMMNYIERSKQPREKILFWNTYSGAYSNDLIPNIKKSDLGYGLNSYVS